jgi:ATP-dependent DNA helicase PIF1
MLGGYSAAAQAAAPPRPGPGPPQNGFNAAVKRGVEFTADARTMHNMVYMTEDDFDDDAELGLEIEDPSTKGSLPQASQSSQPLLTTTAPAVTVTAAAAAAATAATAATARSVTTTTATLARQVTPADDMVPPKSSNPLPWSSSPAQPAATLFGREQVHSESLFVPEQPVELTQDSGPQAKRRRVLPWKNENSDDEDVALQPKSSGSRRLAKDKSSKRNDSNNALWNQSASVVKESQKRLKQSRKKLLASNDNPPDAQLGRKPQTLGRVFLSEEQKAVADLVVQQKKSVFFTGSAGMSCLRRGARG